MKIQAKNVKIGMTITWGVMTVKIEEIINGTQKNGKETVTFKGQGLRSYGRNHPKKAWPNYEFTMKAESFAKAK